MNTKEIALINLRDASQMLVILRYNLDILIDQCEFENRYPSIKELRNLREHVDDADTYVKRAKESIING